MFREAQFCGMDDQAFYQRIYSEPERNMAFRGFNEWWRPMKEQELSSHFAGGHQHIAFSASKSIQVHFREELLRILLVLRQM